MVYTFSDRIKLMYSSTSSPSNPPDPNNTQSPPSDPRSEPGSDPNYINRTPEKPDNPPRRYLMTVKQVREAAKKLQSSNPNKPGPIRDQFGSGQPIKKKKKKKKKFDEFTEIPDKFKLLCKFFDCLVSSLRLLKLKGMIPSLKNISRQIECLTDRKFSTDHLAQLKYVLPESIVLKKVLVHDEKTFCMKPDIHVTLNTVPIKNERVQHNLNGRPDMKRTFRSRLVDFVKTHPKEDIPEGPLPEPFNRSQINLSIRSEASTSSPLLSHTLLGATVQQPATLASHLSQTSRPRFSKQVSSQSTCDCQASIPFSQLPETPIKNINHVNYKAEGTSTLKTMPGKVTSTPEKLMIATPALAPPKRCYMTPDGDSVTSPNKFVKRPVCSRFLKFDTPVKSAEVKKEVEIYAEDLSSDEIFKILPKSLVQSIREKELRAVSQAKRREEMIAKLPKLFNMIRYSFQSSKHSLITKEELLHRLVTPGLDIIDKEEVEEQLLLLKELVPDLIYEKLAPSGDLLVGINKLHIPELICARLKEAK